MKRRAFLGTLSGLVFAPIRAAGSGEMSATGPPMALNRRLADLAQPFEGRVGIAVESLSSGWTAAYDGDGWYPQQSVSKLWVALAVLDAVDQGAIRLDQRLVIHRDEMSVFHQPIQRLVGPNGYAVTIDALLVSAIAQSDNAANDILLRRVGGPRAVQRVLDSRRLQGILGGMEERLLQSQIAGLTWRPEYSFGDSFWEAREWLDPDFRRARLNAYLADPSDGATPRALAHALVRLARGELLSARSTQRFLQILAATDTGPQRLRAGLAPGWSIGHKTGTGQVLGELATGYNDVGLLSAPDGAIYATVVMIASTRRPVPERQALMAAVARAVVAQHDSQSSGKMRSGS